MHRSNLSTQNKITLYKTIIKPVWIYGIQLWGTASNSNIEILQRFQSKTLRSLLNAPWYVTNETIHRDLKIPTVKDEIHKSRSRYNSRVNNHHNPLVTQLLDTTDQIRRLKRKYPLCSAAQHICTPSRAAWQPTVYVPSYEPSIGPRTHHKVEILTALFAHMV